MMAAQGFPAHTDLKQGAVLPWGPYIRHPEISTPWQAESTPLLSLEVVTEDRLSRAASHKNMEVKSLRGKMKQEGAGQGINFKKMT